MLKAVCTPGEWALSTDQNQTQLRMKEHNGPGSPARHKEHAAIRGPASSRPRTHCPEGPWREPHRSRSPRRGEQLQEWPLLGGARPCGEGSCPSTTSAHGPRHAATSPATPGGDERHRAAPAPEQVAPHTLLSTGWCGVVPGGTPLSRSRLGAPTACLHSAAACKGCQSLCPCAAPARPCAELCARSCPVHKGQPAAGRDEPGSECIPTAPCPMPGLGVLTCDSAGAPAQHR